ncbi:O-acetyl-ADP-ribose deacetylase [Xenorhabdus hominickii]|uniref:Orf1a polyprotein n=1 Tax=Xenorhabdus hominickii TaxID=351679 RepID=A0A2G0Q088_XENHO|nr:O-acetyl-ADP-ribose deacetylase [Xenorhabdus hominickii]AOM42713.1 RNase III inhibitor [Xenorhabdus hominickii]PHM52630.1 orf1a polyprotein [Xenorhabdus hominickii]
MKNNRINIIQGDITKIAVEAIVNAANTSLLGGGGVDGAIHRAGGKSILEECVQIRARQGGCDVGDAVITRAGNLPAKYVIHTVGPRWNGGENNEPELLKKAYLSCFDLIEQYNIKTVSFPNISTGIYCFPKKLAAEIALAAIHSSLSINQNILQVNLVCFDNENYGIYRTLNQ